MGPLKNGLCSLFFPKVSSVANEIFKSFILKFIEPLFNQESYTDLKKIHSHYLNEGFFILS